MTTFKTTVWQRTINSPGARICRDWTEVVDENDDSIPLTKVTPHLNENVQDVEFELAPGQIVYRVYYKISPLHDNIRESQEVFKG